MPTHWTFISYINGHFDNSKDRFTPVSSRGLVVVDYCICPRTYAKSFVDFQVVYPLEVVHMSNLDINSSVPDHRILTVRLKVDTKRRSTSPKSRCHSIMKFIQENFMRDETARQALLDLASKLSSEQENTNLQGHIDTIYNEFCSLLDSHLITKNVKTTVNTSNSKSVGKKWWNEIYLDWIKKSEAISRARSMIKGILP